MKNIPIFPDLGWFVIMSPNLLKKEMHIRNIKHDLLQYMTENENADELTNMGYIIPIMDIEENQYEYYSINVKFCSDLKGKDTYLFVSDGNISICGVGYLSDFNEEYLLNNNKLVSLSIPHGKYQICWELDYITYTVNILMKLLKD